MIYQVVHSTRYDYLAEVAVSHHLAHLRPRSMPGQRTLDHALEIDPAPAVLKHWTDYHGNEATFFTLEENHASLVVVSRARVEVQPKPRSQAESSPPWEQVAALRFVPRLADDGEGMEFAFPSPLIGHHREFGRYARRSFPPGCPLLEGALDLMRRMAAEFEFDQAATSVATPVLEALRKRRGVCQDFAQVMIACLRSLGLPARYVSGYLETLPPPGQPKLQGADASHAWVSVFSPGQGWVDFDPTNNLLPGERHITIGWGRDFSDVSPIRGVLLGSGDHELEVSVDVIPE
ncbi:MAG: transglutaminase family protein [Verrucomicrobiae bacterium]|nr:transglutaminase family protein [Verrucomicrobiae bacterium]